MIDRIGSCETVYDPVDIVDVESHACHSTHKDIGIRHEATFIWHYETNTLTANLCDLILQVILTIQSND